MSDLSRPLQQIEAEINILKVQTAQNIIEIGKRLIEAKAQLPHGEWLPWLKNKVDFSEITAQRFMRVANEISNTSTLKDLPISKVYALLDIPADDRQQFIEEKHEINGVEKSVDEMTTRELQKVIKEKAMLEQRIQALDLQLKETQDYADEKELELRQKDKQLRELQQTQVKVIEKIPDDYEKIKEQNNILLEQKQQVTRQLQEVKTLHTDIVSFREFQDNIGYFLSKMAKYTYHSEAFSLLEKREQTEFLKQVEKIDIWCVEAKRAIRGEKSEKTIIFEGGFRDE